MFVRKYGNYSRPSCHSREGGNPFMQGNQFMYQLTPFKRVQTGRKYGCSASWGWIPAFAGMTKG